ncbi:hypothetical protein GH714_011043 [Hevea brasiliensis]|uniref:Uncharacterized protein n=1 Tax=Hevea brasiliensis TaxID=3981 RepID=A0A6A6L8G1_HEVBR|nr:hypothetical protein GH714_011043 [Hevea brasiliensis]
MFEPHFSGGAAGSSVWVSVKRYLKVYIHVTNPINGHDMWPKAPHDNKILPPEAPNKKRGRKHKARRKEAEELEQAAAKAKLGKKGSVAMTCAICGRVGHNKMYHGQMGTKASGAQPIDGTTSSSNQKGTSERPQRNSQLVQDTVNDANVFRLVSLSQQSTSSVARNFELGTSQSSRATGIADEINYTKGASNFANKQNKRWQTRAAVRK